jgi:hypothetical protein
MCECADPVELVDQSRQTSSNGFESESCDCDCSDGATVTDMYIRRSLTPQEQSQIPSVAETETVWVGSTTLILDANGAN